MACYHPNFDLVAEHPIWMSRYLVQQRGGTVGFKHTVPILFLSTATLGTCDGKMSSTGPITLKTTPQMQHFGEIGSAICTAGFADNFGFNFVLSSTSTSTVATTSTTFDSFPVALFPDSRPGDRPGCPGAVTPIRYRTPGGKPYIYILAASALSVFPPGQRTAIKCSVKLSRNGPAGPKPAQNKGLETIDLLEPTGSIPRTLGNGLVPRRDRVTAAAPARSASGEPRTRDPVLHSCNLLTGRLAPAQEPANQLLRVGNRSTPAPATHSQAGGEAQGSLSSHRVRN